MVSRRLAMLMPMLAALAACSTTPRVRHDSDGQVNLANYHSYVWEQINDDATPGGSAFRNPINQKRLRNAVENNLARFGMQPTPQGGTPDSYVTVAMGTRQTIEHDYAPVQFGFGWGSGWGPGWGYGGRHRSFGSLHWSNDTLYSYREGRVTVDLYDAKTREPLWHAEVEQDLSYLTGSNAEARINAVVAAMFTKFPGASTAAK